MAEPSVPELVIDADGCEADNLCYSGGVGVKADPALPWRALVERGVAEGWLGLAELGAFDGTVGEAVATNFTAFGASVGEVVWSVRVSDGGQPRTLPMAECGFTPSGSALADPRYRIELVEFLFRAGTVSAPVVDPDLARLFGEKARVALPDLRDAVRGFAQSVGPAV